MGSRVKTFKFKKIDWYGRGRKINQPEVTITLKYDDEDRPCLSICGNIWNNIHTDIVCGGQNLDEMIKFDSISSDPVFNKLYYLWVNYHLNDCRSAGPLQEVALKACKFSSYEECCSYLESIGLLYEDGIKYGSTWWYHKIPNEDLQIINDLFDQKETA